MSARQTADTHCGNDPVDAGRQAWTVLLGLLLAHGEPMQEVWDEFDLSSAQGNLINTLQPSQPVTMVSLAKSLRCHDSNVTGLVDRLEVRGLVERRSNPKDRRVKLIALTEAGQRMRESLLQRIYEPPSFIVSLTPDDQQALLDILQRSRG